MLVHPAKRGSLGEAALQPVVNRDVIRAKTSGRISADGKAGAQMNAQHAIRTNNRLTHRRMGHIHARAISSE